MLWIVLILLLILWVIRFGLGLGGVWIPAGMTAGWFYFLANLLMRHEHD